LENDGVDRAEKRDREKDAAFSNLSQINGSFLISYGCAENYPPTPPLPSMSISNLCDPKVSERHA